MDTETKKDEKTVTLKATEVNALLARIEALEKNKKSKASISTEKKLYN